MALVTTCASRSRTPSRLRRAVRRAFWDDGSIFPRCSRGSCLGGMGSRAPHAVAAGMPGPAALRASRNACGADRQCALAGNNRSVSLITSIERRARPQLRLPHRQQEEPTDTFTVRQKKAPRDEGHAQQTSDL
jgi:hypothetical protein